MAWALLPVAALSQYLSLPTEIEVLKAAHRPTTKEYLNLSVGLTYDERNLPLPKDISVEGTFRKFVTIEWNAEKRILRFNPKSPGVGTLIVKHPATGTILLDYTLDVRHSNLQKTAREIQALLENVEGIQIKILNNKIVVDGEVLVPSDIKRIHAVVKQFLPHATSLVIVSPAAQIKIAQLIERKIGNPEIRVTPINGKYILEGYANSRDDKDRAEILAKLYMPDVAVDEAVADKKILVPRTDVVVNLIAVRPSPEAEPNKIIQLTVHYVELQKDYTKAFRFQFLPDLGDGSTLEFSQGSRAPSGLTATLTGTVSNLLPRLNAVTQAGYARVLQGATVIVEEGKPGLINSTTRLPYQVVNAQGQPSTNFEEAGLRTNITPTLMGPRSDTIKLSLSFAVKSLLSYTNQGPLISNHEIQTNLYIRSGQSAAIGGLISHDNGTNYNKLPAGASTNPIVSLYASKDFRRNKSQFVVFVTPVIKSSASLGAEKIKRKFGVPGN